MLATGGVSPTEIWEAFEQIAGIEVTEDDVVQMCEAADEDGNNELDFSEFARMMAISHTNVGKKQVVKVIESRQLVSSLLLGDESSGDASCSVVRHSSEAAVVEVHGWVW